MVAPDTDRGCVLSLGVMRFLQTEWHRHERDRNSWEIEKQEMKARVAMLEGQARRADATQRALRKYVTILEKKVKDQASQLKTGAKPSGPDSEKPKLDRAALIQEKLRCELIPPTSLLCDSGSSFFPFFFFFSFLFLFSSHYLLLQGFPAPNQFGGGFPPRSSFTKTFKPPSLR